MSFLGIYFGSQVISIVNCKGKNLVDNLRIPYSAFSGETVEEKVPEEIKLVTLLKNELIKNNIEVKEAAVCLSGKDLIIRHFEMPAIPAQELASAASFEAKKYIPFKVEELIFDFQWKFDRAIQKNHTVFAGIKKETLEKYLSVFRQLGFNISSFEYSAFSVLRLLRLNNIIEKGNIAVVDVDLTENDEMNFVVLENGFPLFSRDITFAGAGSDLSEIKKEDTAGKEGQEDKEAREGSALEKLKREIRISLDYYNRKFPLKRIRKVFFISAEAYRLDLEAFVKDVGASAQFIDTAQYYPKDAENTSLSFIKAYSVALSKVIKSELKIDLLAPKTEHRPAKVDDVSLVKGLSLSALKIDMRVIILSLLIWVLVFLSGAGRTLSLRKDLKDIISARPRISSVSQNAGIDEINTANSQLQQKVGTIDTLVKKQAYVTSLLDIIPRLLPQGVWLEDFSFRKADSGVELYLLGAAFLSDSAKEFEAVNGLVSSLKNDPVFSRYFSEINLLSLHRREGDGDITTRFEISCKR